MPSVLPVIYFVMNRKYLAFDIETAKILPDGFGDLLLHRPLGITCTETLSSDHDKPDIFYSKDSNGNPASQMYQDDLCRFVDFLIDRTKDGYTIVTLNGLGFDFNILGEESGRLDDCRKLAISHVDMMFHIFCERGFGVGLNAAAQAIGLSKPTDVDGYVAPQLWKDGDYDRVFSYISQDCKITLDVAQTSEANRMFYWINKRGCRSNHELPSGWLTVESAMKLPLPDTSWMDNPWPRSKFTDWLVVGRINSIKRNT